MLQGREGGRGRRQGERTRARRQAGRRWPRSTAFPPLGPRLGSAVPGSLWLAPCLGHLWTATPPSSSLRIQPTSPLPWSAPLQATLLPLALDADCRPDPRHPPVQEGVRDRAAQADRPAPGLHVRHVRPPSPLSRPAPPLALPLSAPQGVGRSEHAASSQRGKALRPELELPALPAPPSPSHADPSPLRCPPPPHRPTDALRLLKSAKWNVNLAVELFFGDAAAQANAAGRGDGGSSGRAEREKREKRLGAVFDEFKGAFFGRPLLPLCPCPLSPSLALRARSLALRPGLSPSACVPLHLVLTRHAPPPPPGHAQTPTRTTSRSRRSRPTLRRSGSTTWTLTSASTSSRASSARPRWAP